MFPHESGKAQKNERNRVQSTPAVSKPSDVPSKYTQETIQISLVRSFTTSESTSTDKTSATTSSGQRGKYSESKESVKDSTTSYSSSDNEPVSSTMSDEESSPEEEQSTYSEESEDFKDSQPTPVSQGVSTYSYKTTRETTNTTGSATTNQSEIPKQKFPKTKRSSLVQNKPSTLTSEKTLPHSSVETYHSTNTGSITHTSSSNNKSLTNSNQYEFSSTPNASVGPLANTLETIDGIEYIRAHLTLPNTNEVISILMKKDENLGQILDSAQRKKHGSEMERSSRYKKRKQKIDEKREEQSKTIHEEKESTRHLQPIYEDRALMDTSLEKIRPSKHFSKLLMKSADSYIKYHHDKNGLKDVRENANNQENNSSLIPSSQIEEKYKLGVKDFTALENKSEENIGPSLREGKSKSIGRYISDQPLSFDLPTLPKLNQKSVSFRINTETIRSRQLKAKSALSIRQQRNGGKISNEINLRQIHNHSSLRCPKFITFDPSDTHQELVNKTAMSDKQAVEKEVTSRGDFTVDIGQPMKSLKLHKASSPMTIILSQDDLADRNAGLLNSETCPSADANQSDLSLLGRSERSTFSYNPMDRDKSVHQPLVQIKPSAANNLGCSSLQASLQRQIKHRLQQKSLQNESPNRHRGGSPYNIYHPGATRNYVRYYETNHRPEAEATRYKFQFIRNKFESANSRDKSVKKTFSGEIPFDFTKLNKNFSSNGKLKKCICQEKHKNNSKEHNTVQESIKENQSKTELMQANIKEPFNNLLKEIIKTAQNKKSVKCFIDKDVLFDTGMPSKSKIVREINQKYQDNTNSDVCTFWKLSDNDSDFRQLQHIFKVMKRTYKKKIKTEVKKKMSSYEKDYGISMEDHSGNIGQHLCRIYLKCFSKVDHTPYSQNDFVNIRKVVDFFLNYLVFEYKYINTHKTVPMENVVYSVYANISQHHFRLKHHLRTSSEIDPQNDPWPVTVYDRLTKFNILVNSKNVSSTSYKESATTKLRQSCSTHSEHSLKYFAIDYFLKLLKIIVIEARDKRTARDKPEEITSGRATASSYNSHHYCTLQSGEKTFSSSIAPAQSQVLYTDTSPVKKDDCHNQSTETDNQSVRNTTRDDRSNRVKHKRYKKRKTRRSFNEKQFKNRMTRYKLGLDLNKFEINRTIFNKTIEGNNFTKSPAPLKTVLKHSNVQLKIKPEVEVNKDQNDVESHVEDHNLPLAEPNEIVHNENEALQSSHLPPPPPPPLPPPPSPPLESIEDIFEDSNLIQEVSSLVKKIVNVNKNANVEKIKDLINMILEENKLQENSTQNVFQRAMVPMNMMQITHKEQASCKKVLNSIETNVNDVHKEMNSEIYEDGDVRVQVSKDRSVSCENRRNKVISSRINQKIMELTKNLSMELPRPIFYDDKKKVQNDVGQTPAVPEASKKIFTKEDFDRNISLVQMNAKSSSKNQKIKDIKIKKELEETPLSSNPNQKTSIISNDDLFFTNRRKLSVFSRPFHSILGFESDLLSDIKCSDDDFSIHELYFKKLYHPQESISITGHQPNHKNGTRMETSDERRGSVLESTNKHLTKKQVEVFNELRTMFQDEVNTGPDSKQMVPRTSPHIYDRNVRDVPYDLDRYMDYALRQTINNRRSISRPGAKKSRSQSCIYENGSHISFKISRSSELLPDTN